MPDLNGVRVKVNSTITPEQLFSFYERNDVCERGFGKDVAAKVLGHSSLIVGAFEGDRLVGLDNLTNASFLSFGG